MDRLKSIFPKKDREILKMALIRHNSFESVVEELINQADESPQQHDLEMPPSKIRKLEPKPDETAGSSKKAASLSISEKMQVLQNMFPQHSIDKLKSFLEENKFNIDDTVDDIVMSKPIFESKKFNTLEKLFSFCGEKLATGRIYRLEVLKESLYNDVIGYYKSSKFNPERPLKIILSPAADYGGVLNHCLRNSSNVIV